MIKKSWSLTTNSSPTVPLGKTSWMNIVLLLHSLLFFLSSSVASLVFFSTSDIMLAHWVSVVILANCSLNFYVYCLSGRQFRSELRRIAKRYVPPCLHCYTFRTMNIPKHWARSDNPATGNFPCWHWSNTSPRPPGNRRP